MTTISGNNYTYTGTDLVNALGYLIERTPTALSSDTLPTGSQIILAFIGSDSAGNIGQCFTVSIYNNSSFSITLNPASGVTFKGPATDTILPQATRTYTFVQTAVSTIICYIIGGAPVAPATNSGINLNNNNILVGNTNNVATGVSMSNDAIMANTGALTLSTVNSNTGTFNAANLTVNAKGLITAAATGVGGSDTQLQFNNSGALGGSSSLTYDINNLNLSTANSSNVISDVMSWTTSDPNSSKPWYSICWGNGQFVAVAGGSGNATGRVATSVDGVTWGSNSASSNNTWVAVCWAQDIQLYAAVSSTGAANSQVMTSSDAISWTAHTASSARIWTCICRGTLVPGTGSATGTGNVFVAMALDGNANQQVMTSPDGTTWTARSIPLALTWTSVCWSDDVQLFVAVASNGTAAQQIMTSPNGITWTASTSPSAQQWQSVCWSSTLSLFCAVASNGTTSQQIMTSPDGINWSSATSPSAQQWESVCWSGCFKIFVAVASDGTANQQIMYSSTGTGTWISATSSSVNTWSSICFSDNITKRFVAVASTASTGNGMYSYNTLSNYNQTLNLGTLGSSTINTYAPIVNIFPNPYYYGESTVVITLTATNTFATDITINNVANGRYIVFIWMQTWVKTGVTASTTEQIRITGSVQGTIFTTPTGGTNGNQSMMGNSSATGVSMGSNCFQFIIKSASSTGYQNISYQVAASSIANTRPFSANPGVLRTMYLMRIS